MQKEECHDEEQSSNCLWHLDNEEFAEVSSSYTDQQRC